MCLIKGAFVGEKNFQLIKMHGSTIKIMGKPFAVWQVFFDSRKKLSLIEGFEAFLTYHSDKNRINTQMSVDHW
jgi:hypothetical protein